MYNKTKDPNYVQDANNKLFVNTNKEQLQAYRSAIARSKKMKSVEEEVNDLKQDMSEIKYMLQKLLESKSQ